MSDTPITDARQKALHDRFLEQQGNPPLVMPPTGDIIQQLQAEVETWIMHNFGNDNELATVGGLMEEGAELCDAIVAMALVSDMTHHLGLLMRAAVKRSQGIRGTADEWQAEIEKESGDVFVKLCDIATYYGFSLSAAVQTRWAEVRQRDWKVDAIQHGITKS